MTATWTPRPGKALAIRTCAPREDGTLTGWGDFLWPSEPGSVVVAPDWDPRPVCGGGLHGLLWGAGDLAYLRLGHGQAFMVVEVDEDQVVALHDDKVKFPRCVVVHVGDFQSCAELIAAHAPQRVDLHRTALALSNFDHVTYCVDLDSPEGREEASGDEYDQTDAEAARRFPVPLSPLARIVSSEVVPGHLPPRFPGPDPFAGIFDDHPIANTWKPTPPGHHTVAIDVDWPVRAIPSSTPGHYHLWIDCPPMPWWRYRRLLRALKQAGVIEPGYYSAAVARRATHLRLPWVRKAIPVETAEQPVGVAS